MEKSIDREINTLNLEVSEKQNKFLESMIGKTINTGIDLGIRALLPDFIEDQIINIKNNLFEYGLKDGIKKTIDDVINIGKSAIGLVTGNFENVLQAQEAVKKGGIIDNFSNLFDNILDNIYKNKKINYNVFNTIKNGKNIILNNIEKNIEKSFSEQINCLEYTKKYIENWKNNFENKNFEGMEKEYKNLKKQLNILLPIEKIINDVRTIENLHAVICNNGQNFNLTEEQLELAQKLY